ncbi:glycosyltransferase [Aureliella helgolandensis]|nr:glycosyltransferase family 2 protein [Aureliella helgolandensis]
MLTVIIPACNEESVIGDCLASLARQQEISNVEILIIANGCSDGTAAIGKSFNSAFAARGISLRVLSLPAGNKNQALNAGDAAARFPSRVYLDADVRCSPYLLSQINKILSAPSPTYASGTMQIDATGDLVGRCYAKIWKATPYIRDTIPGCGCYAVNGPGRQRWTDFPPIHSDDKFVRLHFNAQERVQATAAYYWPLPQGFRTLVRVRTRWTRGNLQLASRYPYLKKNDVRRFAIDGRFLGTLFTNPISTIVFSAIYTAALVTAALQLWKQQKDIKWDRARI